MSFEFRVGLGSDNHSGVHPRVMQAMVDVNRGHAHAYGMDEVSHAAQAEFRRVFGPECEAHYVFTGTAANVLALAPLLKSFEAVIVSEQAHMHLDECAAPEKFWGGKLWTLPSADGKIRPEQVEPLLARRGDQHFAQPAAVSLTLPTELGVVYTRDELRAWRKFTREKNLMLHLDGARFANAAARLGPEIAREADVVSFGGTKNGLLGAEAVLLFSERAKQGFKFHRKQAMQLPSKTRYLAAQFLAYLQDDLWLEIARGVLDHARKLEARLRAEFPEIEIAYPVESNALFVRLPEAWLKPLRDKFFFYVWEPETRLCRWMLGWDWTDELTERLLDEVKACSTKR